ncbi:hypothetical protein ABLE93_25805 [Xanthobacter sp. KR7-65]|uniref:hypothetical protein n=1 Tax=Xanthobacter sp. KR7-65 TaxID=3156612 RepID=UPI0032B4F726
MSAFFLVRANVADPADRPGFDEWYRAHHLPLARSAFGAEHAVRMWSRTDPAVHIALYRFPSLAAVEAITTPEILTPLLADFDAAWPQVTRTREVLEGFEELRG